MNSENWVITPLNATPIDETLANKRKIHSLTFLWTVGDHAAMTFGSYRWFEAYWIVLESFERLWVDMTATIVSW